MAYNSGYNPDALPAHAEPEQAAQILSTQQQRKQSNPSLSPFPRPYSNSNPQPYAPPSPGYQSKPQPPLPGPAQTPQVRPPPQPSPPFSSHQQYAPNQPLYPQNQQQPPSNRPPYSPNQQQYAQNQQQYSQNQQPYIQPQTQSQNHSSPPPSNYGFGPPPQAHHGRPPPQSRPPPTPAPGSSSSSADASLFPLFKAVDKSGTGQLTERELRHALVNGDFTNFDLHTVKMMIRMFDVDKSGSINFDEFCGLWGFLAAWRALFDRFDEDKSGHISYDEYSKALIAFGYRLSSSFVNLLYTTYDKSGEGKMSFDLFVQSCIILKRMTDVFKKYDDDRDGYITLSFEEFLTEILRQR